MSPSSSSRISRRQLASAVAGFAAIASAAKASEPLPKELAAAVAGIEPYLFTQERFGDVSRGTPLPHSITEEKRKEVGLTRDTWRLEVVSDPQNRSTLGRELTKENGLALDFAGLMKLAEKHAVRFPKIMTCLNLGCPLGMGIWEGVPLREVVWLTQPKENLRRVFYYGYHNDDPKQLFQSSLPVGRVLEDPYDLPPVILCYKLNGQWLDPKRGAPVRILIPEAYGFKCVKWLQRIVLSNIGVANDTYIDGNNDVDSPLKTFSATLSVAQDAKAGKPVAVTGWAQSGISGLSKVQTFVQKASDPWPADDPYFTRAAWSDARILPPPTDWGAELPGGKIPADTYGFDALGRPKQWPMRNSKALWAALLPPMPAGEYVLRCRTIDEKGQAQPMPRPFRKSGWADLHSVRFTVAA